MIKKVEEIIGSEPNISIRRLAQRLSLSDRTIRKILKEDLKMFPYKIQVHQRLNDEAISKRYTFASDLLEMIDSKRIDPTKTIFSDEAHIWLDGYINS